MKALYRTYRPKVLADVIGQEQVTKPLENSLKANKISHAYLFIGPRGCGKTSVARILAHEVNGFKYELEDNYIDIIEIDGASNRGIDNIRELREKVMVAPTLGKYKVYIIDEVHMLTKEAFNALLKTLEEPPKHVIFIMATTDAHKVPVTITSRAQTYTFHLADSKTIFDHLKHVCEQEKIAISDDALSVVVKRGGGSFRDSLSLLDQISTLSDKEITKELVISAIGLPEDEKIKDILEAYLAGDLGKITGLLKDILSAGAKPETIAEEMVNFIIESARPEFFPLLSKLIEIKAPFAEARLLVALTLNSVASAPRATIAAPVSTRPAVSATPAKPAPATATTAPAQPEISQEAPTEPSIAPTGEFSWDVFLERVKSLNDAIYTQLLKTTHKITSNTVEIYPEKKIVKTILTRDNNKQILINAADGYKVLIHEYGESAEPKNATIAKISDIMGGEVTDDGGGNPF